MIRTPLARGLLSGKFPAGQAIPPEQQWRRPTGDRLQLRLQRIEQLRFLERDGQNMAQAALRWLLAQPGVHCVIPGARTVEQLEANIGADRRRPDRRRAGAGQGAPPAVARRGPLVDASSDEQMPLQNRVTPFGEIVAVPERGTMMGNRGILHDAHGRAAPSLGEQAWICCLLEFRGRRDPVMAPGHYTRLFFLDEPTALAAGHRPCAYCRRDAYRAFRAAWAAGNAHLGLGATPRAAEIDRVLHDERSGPGGSKRLHRCGAVRRCPTAVFVTPRRAPIRDQAPMLVLVWQAALWRWSPRRLPARPARSGRVRSWC